MVNRSDRDPPSLNENPSFELLGEMRCGSAESIRARRLRSAQQAGYKPAASSVEHHTEENLPSGGVHIIVMQVTRGFKGKQGDSKATTGRVPPGQYATQDFPVLTSGPTQRTSLASWSLVLQDGGQLLARWNWTDFEALPQTE